MSFFILSGTGNTSVSTNNATILRLLEVLVDVDSEWSAAVDELKASLSEADLYATGNGYIVPSMYDTANTLIYCIRKTLGNHEVLINK